MEDYKKIGIAVLGLLILGGGIFLVIYLTQGGEGESTDIPGNPSEVVVPLRLAG